MSVTCNTVRSKVRSAARPVVTCGEFWVIVTEKDALGATNDDAGATVTVPKPAAPVGTGDSPSVNAATSAMTATASIPRLLTGAFKLDTLSS